MQTQTTKTIKYPVRYKFNPKKLATCAALLAKANLPELTKLKLVKLLYYIDKQHLLKYGRPVTGDTYFRWDHGPVPIRSLSLINEVGCNDEFREDDDDSDWLAKYVKINKYRARVLPRRYPLFELKEEPNLDCLSASEQEVIREVIKKYGSFTPMQLRNETHKDYAWRATEKNEEIDYSKFFEEEPDASPEARAYLESLREDSELVFGLSLSDSPSR